MITTEAVGFAPDYVPYLAAWELQRRTHRNVADGRQPDTLLLLEHEAVYTAGRRTEDDERPVDGTPVVDVDRGGKITWHGPGQLVGYPIMRLPEPVDVVGYVRTLERALIDVLAELDIYGEQLAGRSGVWVASPNEYDKIAAIGIRVAEKVTMHGFALNCSNDLDAFSRIVPCGIRDAGVTSISTQCGRVVTPAELIPTVEAALVRTLSREETVLA